MPYLRLYSNEMTIQEKRRLAQRLTDITLRTLQLRSDQKSLITIQFVPFPEAAANKELASVIPSSADVAVEVVGHNLTANKRRAFSEEVSAVLTGLVPARRAGWIGRLLRREANAAKQIALQFNELVPEDAGSSFEEHAMAA
jgi:phenylpyruvate tautomerase PptA (4-oxalocrotonate tautomerase family)